MVISFGEIPTIWIVGPLLIGLMVALGFFLGTWKGFVRNDIARWIGFSCLMVSGTGFEWLYRWRGEPAEWNLVPIEICLIPLSLALLYWNSANTKAWNFLRTVLVLLSGVVIIFTLIFYIKLP